MGSKQPFVADSYGDWTGDACALVSPTANIHRAVSQAAGQVSDWPVWSVTDEGYLICKNYRRALFRRYKGGRAHSVEQPHEPI